MAHVLLALVLASGLLTAQKVLLQGDPNQQLAAFNVADVIKADSPSGPAGCERLVDILRGTITHPGHSLAAIGPSHVVAIGSPVWVGSVESMIVHLRKAREAQFQIDLRVCEMPAAFAQGQLRALLAQESEQAVVAGAVPILGVISNESLVRLTRAMKADPAIRILQTPQVTTRHLWPTRIRVGRDVDYVRTLDLHDGPDGKQVAAPVLDKLWRGCDATVAVAKIGKDRVAVDLDLLVNSFDLPMQKFRVDVAGLADDVMVDVPRVKSFRGGQFAEIAAGNTAIMAAPSGDAWVLTMLTVQEVR
jgi:hypothetical protein